MYKNISLKSRKLFRLMAMEVKIIPRALKVEVVQMHLMLKLFLVFDSIFAKQVTREKVKMN